MKKKILIILISLVFLVAVFFAVYVCLHMNRTADKGNSEKNEKTDISTERASLKWWQDTIVYEAYPSSFQDTDGDGYGDLQGLIKRLDYLNSLGVGAIWLTPVYASPMGDNGYDISDYRAINPRYGTMEDMEELIAEADKRGIRIVMDLVFNHTSNECDWFKQSSSSKDNAYSDWYIWADADENGREPNNWGGIFGGSAWTWSNERQQYYLHTFADFQPDLNWENENVRRELYSIANFWIGKGVGGFRLDAVTYIKKPADFSDGPVNETTGMASIHNMTANTEGILDFLHEFKENVQQGTDIFTVGEANGVPASELTDWVGENGVFDMIFEFSHVDVQFAGGENWCNTKNWPLTDLKKALSASQSATANNGWCPIFLENHDQPRSVNHFLPEGADGVLGAKALGMLVMSLRGTPFLYEGEELGMTNVERQSINEYDDISTINQYKIALNNGYSEEKALLCVQKYSRDNARTPMQWDDSENAGFTTGKPWLALNDNYVEINAAKEEEDANSVLNWYRQLNKIRQEHDALVLGDYQLLLAEDEQIFAFARNYGQETISVLINFTGETVSYEKGLLKDGELIISNYDSAKEGILQPYQAVLYKSR